MKKFWSCHTLRKHREVDSLKYLVPALQQSLRTSHKQNSDMSA